MNGVVTALAVFSFSPAQELSTALWQIVPHAEGEVRALNVTRQKAVLCIPGLYPHPIQPSKALAPEKHPWFEPRAPLLAALAPDFDVYALGYAQTLPLDAVASSSGMRSAVARLKRAGYREIVLIGHSAGGIVAHQFAERYPDSGVTKIIPVAAPYLGSDLAEIGFGLPKTQVAYIKSIAPQPRREATALLTPLPKHIDICCVSCKITYLTNDILVNLESQWPPEVRRHGIPTTLVGVNHFDALKAPQAVEQVTLLAKSRLTRWNEEDVARAEKVLFGPDVDDAMTNPPTRDRPILRRAGHLLERVIGDRHPKRP